MSADVILVLDDGDLVWAGTLPEGGDNYVDWACDRNTRVKGYLLVFGDQVKALRERSGSLFLASGDSLRVTFTDR